MFRFVLLAVLLSCPLFALAQTAPADTVHLSVWVNELPQTCAGVSATDTIVEPPAADSGFYYCCLIADAERTGDTRKELLNILDTYQCDDFPSPQALLAFCDLGDSLSATYEAWCKARLAITEGSQPMLHVTLMRGDPPTPYELALAQAISMEEQVGMCVYRTSVPLMATE